jgi:PAS domain S-box-containing protein
VAGTEHHGLTLYEAIAESLPHPVLVHDVDTILYANKAALRVLRALERCDVEGHPVDRFTHKHSLDSGRERRRLMIEHGAWLRGVEARLVACDGSVVEVRGEAGPISVAGKTVVMLVGTVEAVQR